ncbi:hypothetical protein [Caballeronia ptereochthonis]|uniref:hypothetical protein n=1 Tax=Caballeronia ptereochthonis TaxID=1777144 RepID=UPI000B310493|nr:hypothetical protein [Caballeronia ptereochthonis]
MVQWVLAETIGTQNVIHMTTPGISGESVLAPAAACLLRVVEVSREPCDAVLRLALVALACADRLDHRWWFDESVDARPALYEEAKKNRPRAARDGRA